MQGIQKLLLVSLLTTFGLARAKWTESQPMMLPVADPAAAVFDGKIYVVGGLNGGSLYHKEVQAFDGDGFSMAPSMQTDRGSPATAVFQSRLYAIGGVNGPLGSNVLDSVEVFDGKTWTFAPSMTTKRIWFAAATLKDKVYTIGGFDQHGFVGVVEVFDGKKWGKAPSMPTKRANAAATVLNEKLYVIGGNNDDGPLDTVEVFDGVQWTTAKPMPTKRGSLATAVYNSRIYALGGYVLPTTGRGRIQIDVAESFDGQTWASAPSMPTKRGGLAAASLNGKLFAFGGGNDIARVYLNVTEVFAATTYTRVKPVPKAFDGRSGLPNFV